MKRALGLAGMMVAALTAGPAEAALSIFANVGGAPSGVNRWNLDGAAPADVTVQLTPDAAFVTGSQNGVYAAPFLSGNNGIGFGAPDQPNGQDTTQYLTTGSTGATPQAKVELIFASGLQQYFGLLWGSVDTYNTIEFFNGAVSVGALTGSDVTPTATGDQGSNGTFYVNINSTLGFDRVVMTSSQFAFEFDNIAWTSRQIEVPEPMSLALLGLGLAGLGLARRRAA